MFQYFWGGVFVTLPLFLKLGSKISDARYSQDFFLFACAIISVLLFGFFKETKLINKVLFSTFSAFVFFNASDFTTFPYVYHLLTINAVLLFGLQVSSLTSKNLNILLNGIAISVIIQVSFCVLQFFGANPRDMFFGIKATIDKKSYGFVGTLGNPNVLGSMVAVASPVFFRKKWVYLLPIPLLGIYLSESSTPVLVFIGVLAGFYIPKIQKLYYLIPFGGLMGTICLVKSGLVENHRIAIWRLIIFKAGFKKWLLGWGTAFIPNNANEWKAYGSPAIQAHNEYLELFYTYGIVGVGILTIFLLKSYKPKRPILSAILLGSFVSSLTHFNMHISITALFFTLALCYPEPKGNYV